MSWFLFLRLTSFWSSDMLRVSASSVCSKRGKTEGGEGTFYYLGLEVTFYRCELTTGAYSDAIKYGTQIFCGQAYGLHYNQNPSLIMAYKTLHDFNSTSVSNIIYVTFPWVQSSQTSFTFFLDFEDKVFSISRPLHLVIPGHIAHLSLVFARISFRSQLPCQLLMESFLTTLSEVATCLIIFIDIILLYYCLHNFYHNMTSSCLFTSLSPLLYELWMQLFLVLCWISIICLAYNRWIIKYAAWIHKLLQIVLKYFIFNFLEGNNYYELT